MRQHTSAYVSIRQHTSAYVSIRGVEVVDQRLLRPYLSVCTSKASKLNTARADGARCITHLEFAVEVLVREPNNEDKARLQIRALLIEP